MGLLHELWTGCGPDAADAAQRALLERFVRAPFTLRQVPIELPTLVRSLPPGPCERAQRS